MSAANPPPGHPGHVHEIDRDCCMDLHLAMARRPRMGLRESILAMDQDRRISAYFLLWWAWLLGPVLLLRVVAWLLGLD